MPIHSSDIVTAIPRAAYVLQGLAFFSLDQFQDGECHHPQLFRWTCPLLLLFWSTHLLASEQSLYEQNEKVLFSRILFTDNKT